MGLNISKGNMYDWVSHTWNAIKGECPHDCSYCYMKRWGGLKPTRLDRKEFRTDLGMGNFIFVGSSCDMFARGIPYPWVKETLFHCSRFDNKYLFQSKDPVRMIWALKNQPEKLDHVVCTTIESNRFYRAIMCDSPPPEDRAMAMMRATVSRYVTIEPILDFDLEEMVRLIRLCSPEQVNIGADSGGNGLPEPGIEKVKQLIERLNQFTIVSKKRNLKRLEKV